MAVDTSKIIIGAGTIAVGDYGGATADCGATKDGVEVTCDRTYYDIKCDQIGGTVAKQETDRKFTVKTTLLESTLANLALAMGYPTTVVTGGNSFKLGVPASMPYKKIVFTGKSSSGGTRTYTIPKCLFIGPAGHAYKKDGEVLIPVEIEAIYDATAGAGQEFGTIVDS